MRRMCNNVMAKPNFLAESMGNGVMFNPRVYERPVSLDAEIDEARNEKGGQDEQHPIA